MVRETPRLANKNPFGVGEGSGVGVMVGVLVAVAVGMGVAVDVGVSITVVGIADSAGTFSVVAGFIPGADLQETKHNEKSTININRFMPIFSS
jgi:hypothetical protein